VSGITDMTKCNERGRLLSMAESLIGELNYDRGYWMVSAAEFQGLPDEIYLCVSTLGVDEKTGMFSGGEEHIPREAFASRETLKSAMQSLLVTIIREIKELPPPTENEIAEAVKSERKARRGFIEFLFGEDAAARYEKEVGLT
jgi:hypothetical protein